MNSRCMRSSRCAGRVNDRTEAIPSVVKRPGWSVLQSRQTVKAEASGVTFAGDERFYALDVIPVITQAGLDRRMQDRVIYIVVIMDE